MKRWIALLLMLALLIPILPAVVPEATAAIEKKPFYLINTSDVEAGVPYTYNMPYFWGHPYPAGETKAYVSAYPDPEPPHASTTVIESLAFFMKKDFDSRPEGTRYMNLNLPYRASVHLVEDYVYFDTATKSVRDWTEAFLAEYKRIGGKLDGILIDIEYTDACAYYLCTKFFEKNKRSVYWDIVNNPQYKTTVRPLLEERGFRFWPKEKQDGEKSEIWTIYERLGSEYARERAIWDTVLEELLKQYANESIYEPLLKYYPDALFSDYDRRDAYGWQKTLVSTFSPVLGNQSKVGNVSNYNAYSYRPFATVIDRYNTPAAFNDAKFAATPFNVMMYEFFHIKNLYEPSDNKKISAYITFFNYSPNHPGTYSNTPYYSESIFHIGMMNPEHFLGYIVESEVIANGAYSDDPKVGDYNYAIQVASELVAEVNRVAGYADRKHIPTPVNWNNDFLLTGMYAGGRNIWRITPDTSKGVSLEEFKVKEKAPTFSIGGQTVIFPQGRIIKDSQISQVGTCGYWVETPANVTPVVIADTDRYAQYPSYEEDFEGFTANTAFTNSSTDVWGVIGSNAKVQSRNGNKMLELNADITLKDGKAIANITAGDSYALQQNWEVSFTRPSNGELKLLYCSNRDGGIKIKNGTVYYDQSGTYQQIPNLTLQSGEIYTARRQVDFRNKDRFVCTYSVLDSKGNVLASIKDVPMLSVNLPVSSIALTYDQRSGAVYLDDFKLYPAGVTTDFEIYDVEFGYQVKDPTQARKKDTAYRLSWLNATDTYKVAKVYNHNTLVEEIKMAPGKDGVATGIVKVAAGKTALLTVKTEETVGDTYPNYDMGNFDWKPGETSTTQPDGGNTPSDGTNNPSGDTQPTTPTTPVDDIDPTIPTNPEGNTDGTDPVNPTDPDHTIDPTYPSDCPVEISPEKDGFTGGQIALIVTVSVLVVLAGAFAVLWFAVKPRWFRKSE